MCIPIFTLLVAILVALMARQLKISEFRQTWIEGIRKDCSEFMTKAYEWMDLYQKSNGEAEQDIQSDSATQLDRIKYDAFHVLWRIELRFKPGDAKANELVLRLKDLLNPAKLTPGSEEHSWRVEADVAVLETRRLLKEEWEITKNPFLRWASNDA